LWKDFGLPREAVSGIRTLGSTYSEAAQWGQMKMNLCLALP